MKICSLESRIRRILTREQDAMKATLPKCEVRDWLGILKAQSGMDV